MDKLVVRNVVGMDRTLLVGSKVCKLGIQAHNVVLGSMVLGNTVVGSTVVEHMAVDNMMMDMDRNTVYHNSNRMDRRSNHTICYSLLS